MLRQDLHDPAQIDLEQFGAAALARADPLMHVAKVIGCRRHRRGDADRVRRPCFTPGMRIERIVPDLTVTNLADAVREHTEVLGLRLVMDHGWIVTLADDDGRQLNLMTSDATAAVNPDMSVFVDDVRAAYDAAVETRWRSCIRSPPRSGASPGSSTATRPAG
ncbi:hypothetical protein GCM10029992_00590 [Glycomyces albus]